MIQLQAIIQHTLVYVAHKPWKKLRLRPRKDLMLAKCLTLLTLPAATSQPHHPLLQPVITVTLPNTGEATILNK